MAITKRLSQIFGAWVRLEAEDGAESRYRIVGPDEFDMEPGYISMDSPLGRALLRKRLAEEVRVETPGGQRSYDQGLSRQAEGEAEHHKEQL